MDPFSQPPDPDAVAPVTATVIEPEVDANVPSRPKRGRVVAIVAAVAVVAAGGIVVATNISSSDGGYDTPEDAVAALMSAVDKEDLLGVIDVIRPGERALVRDTMLPLEKEMERLKVLDTDVDMHKVSGLQFEVQGMTSTSEPVGDRVALVTMNSGTLTSSASVADLPLGPLVRDSVKPGDTPAKPQVVQLKGTKMATVREDGRWYVSYAYSIAESARRSAGKPMPDFAHPIPAVGASDPEAAARGMITALTSLNLSDAIGLLAPSEFGALQDYGTLFVPEAQRSIDEWKSGSEGLTIEVTPGTAKVDQHGDHATVAFDQFSLSGKRGSDSVKVVVDAQKCATIDSTVNGETNHQHVCAGDATSTDTDVPADVKPTLERLKALSPRIVVVKENGHWYVAPVRTWFDLVQQVLKAFASGDDAKAFADWMQTSLTKAFDNVVTSSDTSSDGSIGSDPSLGQATLPADLAAFDVLYRQHVVPDGPREDVLKTLTGIPPTVRFFDSSYQWLPAGDFTDAIGAGSTLDGTPVCIELGYVPEVQNFQVPCPTG